MKEKLFESLMEKVTDFAIIFKDTNGIIREWNVGAERLFGWRRDEAVGRSIQIIYTPDDRENRISPKEMAIAAETGVSTDDRWHIRKDGTFFFASGLLHSIFEDGKLTAFVKIVRDLTKQVELEAAIEESHNAIELRVEERSSELGEANKILQIEMSRQKRDDYLRLRLMQRVLETQEDERKRISRDIHDHLGQELTALRLRVQILKDQFSADPVIAEQVRQLQELTETIDNTVDFLAWELRPNAINEIGLEESLVNYVTQWSKQFKVSAAVKAVGLSDKRLTPVAEVNLYRIAQESLNNVAKHANASNVSVLLEKREKEVALIIEDDGQGFDVEEKSNRAQGLGLIGMGERAALLQGRVEIESAIGRGTSIYVQVPAYFENPEA